MRYPRYKEYRNTGNKLIGDIPSHWEARKIKFLANIQNGRDYKHVESDDGFDVIGSGGAFVKASEYLYDGESVLFGRKGTIDVPLYINDKFWTVDTMFYSVIHESTVAKFLYYCATVMSFKYLATQTALPSITQFDLENYFLTYPNRDEQQKIADFLDYKTQQIDQLIEKKKTLIEKLNEQRIAVITQAVTKGLDKAAKMKPSGVDWLGDVPEHWDVVKLRFLVTQNFTNGIFKKAVDWGTGVRVVNVFDTYVHNEIIDELSLDRVECEEEEKEKFSAQHGDFFFVRSSLKLEGVGKSAVILNPEEQMVFECHLVRGRPNLEKLNPRFLNLFLNSKYARDYLVSRANTVTMATIDQSKFKDLIVSMPNFDEQKHIVERVDHKLNHIDSMVGVANKVIEHLNEYRSSLITAAVTGKIDVRDFAIPGLETA